ncbi:thioredoxin domain-containing protein [Planctomonas sp. JC2975]|uniref:DsbA family protein n=1 Tax=Planctomonas sp. JC2975 TaxID=2729626 RepID=UPI00147629E2|nr:thioredoxin domain-containing protein [Planctomonas sp. JC2975]NNC10591.1 thioredoxin domain-containing protein [Planctomonas sp. JC2975]
MTARLAERMACVLLSAAAALLLAGCASPNSPIFAHQTQTVVPTSSGGVLDLNADALVVGSGPTVVDTYVDPMCPYCGAFERANGKALTQQVNDGAITLRVHPMNFLDRSSRGTSYSSRASSALACVAESTPKATLAYLGELYDNQPQEGTGGLSDKGLTSLAHIVGADAADGCITSYRYAQWVTQITQNAVNGPIPGADIKAITQTPTILVNGHLYAGDITSTAALQQFITSGGK